MNDRAFGRTRFARGPDRRTGGGEGAPERRQQTGDRRCTELAPPPELAEKWSTPQS